MDHGEDYIELNRLSWNARVSHHFNSEFYSVEEFIKGKNSLNPIELALLGDVKGLSILHLQCHFGQDSLSLSRMGAMVTGVDLSDEAIRHAAKLNSDLGLDAKFICCDLYDLPLHLHQKFDMVFTSYGTIGWLPDMKKWAKIISGFLKPAGKFIFVEFHPVVWMYDNDFTKVEYNYFNKKEIVESVSGTYADKNAPIQHKTISWNHDLGEVLGALMEEGLTLTHFKEYNYSPYDCFNNMEKVADNKFQLTAFGDKIPLVYSLTAIK